MKGVGTTCGFQKPLLSILLTAFDLLRRSQKEHKNGTSAPVHSVLGCSFTDLEFEVSAFFRSFHKFRGKLGDFIVNRSVLKSMTGKGSSLF